MCNLMQKQMENTLIFTRIIDMLKENISWRCSDV